MKVLLVLVGFLAIAFGAHFFMVNQVENPFHGTSMELAADAVMKQDTEELLRIVKRDGVLNQFRPGGCRTLLSYAIVNKKLKSEEALLQMGADPNLSRPDCGVYAMNIASAMDSPTYLEILLDHGGSPNARDGDGSPITETAAGSFRWDNFWLLVNRGADVNAFDRENFNKSAFTLVSSLASINQFEQVYKLAERGASLKLLPSSGITVASCIRYNNVDPNSDGYTWMQKVKQLMISQGINLNVPRFGPPPPDQWLPNQPGKEELFKEYENAKAANAKYEREHPSS